MSLVTFDNHPDNKVTEQYSTATGPVLRGVEIELSKLSFKKGGGAKEHSHPEEQVVYVLRGLARESPWPSAQSLPARLLPEADPSLV